MLDPAEVEIFMAPQGPIKEKDCTNVTMQCKVEVGNPEELEQVDLNGFVSFFFYSS